MARESKMVSQTRSMKIAAEARSLSDGARKFAAEIQTFAADWKILER